MDRSLCYVCQQNPPVEGDLTCSTCNARREGKKICGHCGKGALVESMRTTNIIYYDCDNEECGKRQMVQVGGARAMPTSYRAQRPTREQRRRIYARDGYRCKRCGSKRNLSIDHVIPYSQGGSGEDDNLQTLCVRCNNLKADSAELPVSRREFARNWERRMQEMSR